MNQSFSPPDFLKELLDKAFVIAASWMENIIKAIWESYYSYIIFFILCVMVVKILTGRVGSLIYNIIYFGLLLVILLIGGIKIIFNPYFNIIYSSLYPIAFFLTGRILRKIR